MPLPMIRLMATFALALGLTGCASLNVSSYVARGTDMGQYRTYNWASAAEQATGDPRLDNNTIVKEYVQTVIEHHLRIRGFKKALSPDLLVRYTNVKQEVYTSGYAPGDPYCEDCHADVYDRGTLLIDLLDARTDRLVWRGWVEGSLDGVVDDQDWIEERFDEAVARILRRL
jgi:uncharacterized protein DUF4136